MARDMNKYSEVKQKVEVELQAEGVSETDVKSLDDTSTILAEIIQDNFDKRVQNRTDYMKNTHSRTSFLIDNDIREELDEVVGNQRGLKTQIVNDAIAYAIKGFKKKTEQEYQ